jgi:hypothetical protein
MVLGVQSLKSLGPILWDFEGHTMAFVRNGHPILFTTAISSSSQLTLMVVDGDLMDDLLLHFDNLFTKPSSLPPP